jgi:hypothetical protein
MFFTGNDRGATFVEHAIALPFFVGLILVSVELLRLAYCQLSMQFVLTSVMREASINQSVDISAEIHERLAALGVALDDSNDTITVCPRSLFPDSAPCTSGAIIPGEPLEPVVYRIEKRGSSFMPFDIGWLIHREQITLTSLVLGRNEPASIS